MILTKLSVHYHRQSREYSYDVQLVAGLGYYDRTFCKQHNGKCTLGQAPAWTRGWNVQGYSDRIINILL